MDLFICLFIYSFIHSSILRGVSVAKCFDVCDFLFYTFGDMSTFDKCLLAVVERKICDIFNITAPEHIQFAIILNKK